LATASLTVAVTVAFVVSMTVIAGVESALFVLNQEVVNRREITVFDTALEILWHAEARAEQHDRPVDGFHSAALASGGSDNGAPGLRPKYGRAYYAAFVIDPDGYHIEASTISDSTSSGLSYRRCRPGHRSLGGQGGIP